MNYLNIKKIIENKRKIILIKGFTACYGLGLDSKCNLFIPDFNKGIIHRINKNFDFQDIFFFQKIL